MALIAGIDGAKGGWIAVLLDTKSRAMRSLLLRSVDQLFSNELPTVVAIDIPIGLTHDCARECDVLVRRLLVPRHSSVFPAPLRPALIGKTRQESHDISLQLSGKGVGAQSFAIYAKVKEVDDLLHESPPLQQVIYEVHPELCFWAMNGKKPMPHPKRSLLGASDRLKLIDEYFGPEAFPSVRHQHRTGNVADDDILDALAALWTAERILNTKAARVPSREVFDSTGLRMVMWY